MNTKNGFFTAFNFERALSRPLRNMDISEVVKIKAREERIESAIELYYDQAKFLAQNRHVDVIVCVVPEILFKSISTNETTSSEEPPDEEPEIKEELNFRRALKARAMHLGKPLQLIRSISLEETASGQQDVATKAWNFLHGTVLQIRPHHSMETHTKQRHPIYMLVWEFHFIVAEIISSLILALLKFLMNWVMASYCGGHR